MSKILISGNPDLLEAALKKEVEFGVKTVTIEAEYGDRLVEGSVASLAHHGPRKDNQCPCLNPNKERIDLISQDVVVGISHVDLDTMCGLLSMIEILAPLRDKNESFLKLVAFIDMNGIHKLDSFCASEMDIRKYYACESYIQKCRPQIPFNEVKDVTGDIFGLCLSLREVLSEFPEYLAEGDVFKKKMEDLNKDSFVDKIEDVIVRVHSDFVSHLYTTPDGNEGKAIVSFRTPTGSITVSFADPIPGLSCRSIVQNLWGKEAGGHDCIAGSPRGKRMGYGDFNDAIKEVTDILLTIV